MRGCKAEAGAVPWQVLLEDYNCGTLCGGSILNLKFILTAAHCIDEYKKPMHIKCPEKMIESNKKIVVYPRNIVGTLILYFLLLKVLIEEN